MNNNNQSSESSLSRLPQGDAHGAEAAHTQNWSDISANIWSGTELLAPAGDKGLQANAAGQRDNSGADGSAPAAASGDNGSGKPQESHLPPLTLGDFKEEALQEFDKLDVNHTGAVSIDQLSDAVTDPSITGRAAEALTGMYSVKHDQMNTVATENSKGYTGPTDLVPGELDPALMTRTELENIPDSLVQAQTDAGMLSAIDQSAVRSGLDTSNDGRVSAADLQNSAFSGFAGTYDELAKGYAASHLSAAEQEQVREHGLTFNELNGLTNYENFQARQARSLSLDLQHGGESEANIGQDNDFNNGENPLASIKESDVKQGESGDCYFDAALASVAAHQPEIIGDSIKENQNGSYTVTFKGDPAHPMTVPAPTETELALYNAASPDGIWPNIMEKAFADHQILFGIKHIDDDTAQDAISGGRGAEALALLTGERIKDPRMSQGQAYMEEQSGGAYINSPLMQLEAAAEGGQDAVVGLGITPEGSGLPGHHEYTVDGYTPGANGGTFHLRNPWGQDNRHDGGEFYISANALAASINQVAYEPAS
jgi:hypothetical protein